MSEPGQSTAGATGSANVRSARPGAKLVIELGPLLLFFFVYATYGIKPATGVLMAGTIASIGAAKLVLGHVTPMLWVTAALVCVFGGLTFALDDPRFIKIKPTVVNLLFAGTLAGGLLRGRIFLRHILGEALHLTDIGWRKLTVRWIGFFFLLAGLNEIVWRNLSESAWVNFKVFGILPLTIIFGIMQIGLIRQHDTSKIP